MLSVLVVLHEYGHFLLARRNGVRVDDFALGMGPTLLKWTSKRSGTNYRLNLFPIGGYCAMKGEDGKTTEAEQQRAFRNDGKHDDDNFQAKTPWQRLSIVVAGPIANFIVALVLLFLSAAVFGVADRRRPPRSTSSCPVTRPSRPGLQPGDVITAIDGVADARRRPAGRDDLRRPGQDAAGDLRPRRPRRRRSPSRPASSATPTASRKGGSVSARCRRCARPSIPRRRRPPGASSPPVFIGTLNVLGQLVTNFAADRRPAAGPDRDRPGLGPSRRLRLGSLPVAGRDALDFARHLQPAADSGARRRPRASSSWSRCCAASRSTPKKKRWSTSAVSRR